MKLFEKILHVAAGILVIVGQCVQNSLETYDHSKAVFFQLTLPGIHGKNDNSGALQLSAVFGTS